MRDKSQNSNRTHYYLINSLLLLSILFFNFNCNYVSTSYKSIKKIERSYYDNGQLEYEAEFENEKLNGETKYWSKNGHLISISNYINGKAHGKWEKFYENGNLMYEINYFHGQKNGIEKWYYENGQIQSETGFEFDLIKSKTIRWKQDGTIIYN